MSEAAYTEWLYFIFALSAACFVWAAVMWHQHRKDHLS